MKFFMIVKLTEGHWPMGNKLDTRDCPKYLHESREAAEIELLRLSKKFVFDEFFLVESIATTERNITGELIRVEPI